MTTRELIEELARQGVVTTDWRLRGMVARDEIPRPRLNSSLSFDWTAADLRRIRKAFSAKEATPCQK